MVVSKKTTKDRLKELLAKFLSVKGIVFIAATVLIFMQLIEWWAWLVVAMAFIGIRYLEKILSANSAGK